MECAHSSLKTQLQKIKTGELYPQTPHIALNHALFMLNFLNTVVHEWSAVDRLWHNSIKTTFAKARWKDPCTEIWKEPDPILIWGRGHVCVFSQDENQDRWLPEWLIWCTQKKDNGPKDSLADNRPTETTEWEKLQEEPVIQPTERRLTRTCSCQLASLQGDFRQIDPAEMSWLWCLQLAVVWNLLL